MGDKEEEQQIEKLKLTGGENWLAQVLVKPEIFSIHMKGLKIQALGSGTRWLATLQRLDQLITTNNELEFVSCHVAVHGNL